MKRTIFRTAWAAVLVFTVSIQVFAARMLVPVGKVVGLSLSEGSVTVVAFDETLCGPSREAGLQVGDEIVSIDGKQIDSVADLQKALVSSDGTVEMVVRQNGDSRQIKVAPSLTADGPKLGVYIREGITGIGTVTYYDPEDGSFGALGHGVSDSGTLAPMRSGSVYRASVIGIKPGQVGAPGQLKGSVIGEEAIGTLRANTVCGVFGSCGKWSGEPLPAATADQVSTGPAEILSNIQGEEIRSFSVEIEKVFTPFNSSGRNLLIRVTDPELLAATGGIVAGMSGSPILQNGKIIGAVTHVLINDPTRGYGILMENMLEAAG